MVTVDVKTVAVDTKSVADTVVTSKLLPKVNGVVVTGAPSK